MSEILGNRKTKRRGAKVAEVRREELLNGDINKFSRKQSNDKMKFFVSQLRVTQTSKVFCERRTAVLF